MRLMSMVNIKKEVGMKVSQFIVKVLLSLILAIVLIVPQAFASINLDINLNDSAADIQGDSTYFNSPVSIKILDDNNIEYLNTIKTDENGIFNFSFPYESSKVYDGSIKIEDESKTFKINKDGETGGDTPSTDEVTVYVTIQGYKGKKILNNYEVTTDIFSLEPYLKDGTGSSANPSNDWDEDKFKEPKAAHAMVKALEENHISYNFQDYGWGLYFVMIDGDGESEYKASSGWMYNINNSLASGVQDQAIKDGDKIYFWFTVGGYDNPNDIGNSQDINESIKELNDLVKNINTSSKAKEALKELDNLNDLLAKTINDIEDEEEAINIFEQNEQIFNIIYKLLGNEKTNESQIVDLAVDNIGNTQKILNKIKSKSQITTMSIDMLKNISNMINKLNSGDKEMLDKKSDEFIKYTAEILSKYKISDNRVRKQGKKVTAEISTKDIKEVLKNLNEVDKFKKALKDNDIKGSDRVVKKVTLEVPTKDADQVEANLPSDTLQKAEKAGAYNVVIKTGVASFNIPINAVKDIQEGKTVSLMVQKLNSKDVPAASKAKVPKNTAIYDLEIEVGDQRISNFNNNLEITFPYSEEVKTEEKIIVYFLKDDGTIEKMETEYDAETKTVVFKTNHFSKYFISKEEAINFVDIENHWAKEEIIFLSERDIVYGKTANTFAPEDNITRSEFSALISRMLKYKTDESILVPFTDVAKDKWYYNAVASAYKNGLINGKSGTIFDPEGNITRQEMAKIIAEVLENNSYRKADIEELNIFKDNNQISDWAKEFVALTVREKIINGISNGQGKVFAPLNNATRAESAKMLYELYKLIVE